MYGITVLKIGVRGIPYERRCRNSGSGCRNGLGFLKAKYLQQRQIWRRTIEMPSRRCRFCSEPASANWTMAACGGTPGSELRLAKIKLLELYYLHCLLGQYVPGRWNQDLLSCRGAWRRLEKQEFNASQWSRSIEHKSLRANQHQRF